MVIIWICKALNSSPTIITKASSVELAGVVVYHSLSLGQKRTRSVFNSLKRGDGGPSRHHGNDCFRATKEGPPPPQGPCNIAAAAAESAQPLAPVVVSRVVLGLVVEMPEATWTKDSRLGRG